MSRLTISSSPHIRSPITTAQLMYHVVVALLPATIAGIYLFGWNLVLPILFVGVITAVVSEVVLQKILGMPVTIKDGSAALTGLLLALTLSPAVPWWIVLIGSFVAISSKQLYGGMGQNIFNPALIGRAFIVISWPAQNSFWINPFLKGNLVSTATPLQVWSMQGFQPVIEQFGGSISSLYRTLLLGLHGGCIGEVFIPALLIGLAYLLFFKVISWRIPFSYALATVVFAMIFRIDPVVSLLSGGLLFGAFFMATDYVTSPLLPLHQIIFGVSIGLINMIIRTFTPMPEGTTFAILIMNMLVPLMDRKIRKPVGWLPSKEAKS